MGPNSLKSSCLKITQEIKIWTVLLESFRLQDFSLSLLIFFKPLESNFRELYSIRGKQSSEFDSKITALHTRQMSCRYKFFLQL